MQQQKFAMAMKFLALCYTVGCLQVAGESISCI
jgi:hypothetical protein